MPEITVATPDRLGTDISGDIASGVASASFANTGREVLEVCHTDSGGSSVDVTITTTKTIDGQAVADKVIPIPAGGKCLIGPFPTDIYNDGSGMVNIAIGAGYADIDLQAFRLS